MRKTRKIAAAIGMAALLGGAMGTTANAGDAPFPTDKQCGKVKPKDAITKGWCAAVIRSKGNCLACHDIQTPRFPKDLVGPGNIAPPLLAMKSRFPDKAKLRAQIWDSTAANPESVMIPFGRHKVLTEDEIDNIVEFLLTI